MTPDDDAPLWQHLAVWSALGVLAAIGWVVLWVVSWP